MEVELSVENSAHHYHNFGHPKQAGNSSFYCPDFEYLKWAGNFAYFHHDFGCSKQA
jgi:hypothetical protein